MASSISIKDDSINTQLSTNQNNKCICKIKCNNGKFINGFLCVIPFINMHNIMPVLIINSDILSNIELNENKKLYFTLGNETKKYEIIIGPSRKTFISKKFNIIFI